MDKNEYFLECNIVTSHVHMDSIKSISVYEIHHGVCEIHTFTGIGNGAVYLSLIKLNW